MSEMLGTGAPAPLVANDNARDPDVVDADAVAAMLGLNRKTVYEAAAHGVIPHRRFGRRVLFSRSAVLDWLRCKGSSGER